MFQTSDIRVRDRYPRGIGICGRSCLRAAGLERLFGAAESWNAEGGARQGDGRGKERPEQSHVGDHRRSRRRRVRRRVLRDRSRGAVAGKPRDFGAEGQHGQCIRARLDVEQRRLRSDDGSRVVDGESVFGRAAWRKPVRTAVQQSCRHVRRVLRFLREPRHARRTRWSAARVGGVNVFGGGLGLYACGKADGRRRRRQRRHVMRRSQHRVARARDSRASII